MGAVAGACGAKSSDVVGTAGSCGFGLRPFVCIPTGLDLSALIEAISEIKGIFGPLEGWGESPALLRAGLGVRLERRMLGLIV